MASLVPPEPELERSLHRKNAAEWLFWTLLLPIMPVAWLVERIKRRGSEI